MNDVSIFIFVFVIGASIGSFLNVVVARYNTGLTLSGRSQCMFCGHTLSWYELVPIVSFVIQGGRCRSCKGKISWRYPTVEIITGIVFVLVFIRSVQTIYPISVHSFVLGINLFAASTLMAIAAYDMKHKIIPDFFVYTFIATAFLAMVATNLTTSDVVSLVDVAAGPLLFLPFASLWFFSRGRWMGFGDAKLAWGIGWFLGLSNGIVAIVFAFWIGAVASLLLLGIGRVVGLAYAGKQFTMKSEVPFGPFLILGLLVVWFFQIGVMDLISFFKF